MSSQLIQRYAPTLREVEDWHKNFITGKDFHTNIMSAEVELGPEVDINVFEKAFVLMMKLNRILRSSFPKVDGHIMHDVEPYDEARFGLRKCVDEAATAALSEFRYRTPFELKNLCEAPLLRAGLFRLENGGYLFVYFIHHIICDAFSITILREQLGVLYKNGLSNLDSLSIHSDYMDYYAMHRDEIEAGHAHSLNYWHSRLAGREWQVNYRPLVEKLGGEHEIDVEKLGEYNHSYLYRNRQGEVYTWQMERSLYESVSLFCRNHRVSTFNLLAAGLALLSYQLTDREHGLIQCTYSNRPDSETQRMIGNFTSTVIILYAVAPTLSVYDFVVDFYQSFISSTARPLYNAEILECHGLTARSFACLNYVDRTDDTAPFFAPAHNKGLPAESPLYCVAIEHANTIIFKVEFRTEFYNLNMISNLADRWCGILSAMISTPWSAVKETVSVQATTV